MMTQLTCMLTAINGSTNSWAMSNLYLMMRQTHIKHKTVKEKLHICIQYRNKQLLTAKRVAQWFTTITIAFQRFCYYLRPVSSFRLRLTVAMCKFRWKYLLFWTTGNQLCVNTMSRRPVRGAHVGGLAVRGCLRHNHASPITCRPTTRQR